MNAQIVGCIVHAFFNFIFVSKMSLGVVGCGIASNLTNVFLLICNFMLTKRLEENKEANDISITDKRVWR